MFIGSAGYNLRQLAGRLWRKQKSRMHMAGVRAMTHFNRRHAALDQEPFPRSQAGLFADFNIGMGLVGLSDEFKALPSETKLAILADWQQGLEKERRLTIVRLFREVTDVMGEIGMPQKIAQFREACARLGFECPSDIAILLQQV